MSKEDFDESPVELVSRKESSQSKEMHKNTEESIDECMKIVREKVKSSDKNEEILEEERNEKFDENMKILEEDNDEVFSEDKKISTIVIQNPSRKGENTQKKEW
jgi:hypothetical protein